MRCVYTIGYEGTTIDKFLATLVESNVEVLADVRALPLSRKPGFSKNALRQRLETAGIRYVHLTGLGDPQAGRRAARAGNFARFQTIYCSHFRKQSTQSVFEELLLMARSKTLCMMCFERDPRVCHRDIIAQEMQIRGWTAVDLFVDEPPHHVRFTHRLSGRRAREGVAATK